MVQSSSKKGGFETKSVKLKKISPQKKDSRRKFGTSLTQSTLAKFKKKPKKVSPKRQKRQDEPEPTTATKKKAKKSTPKRGQKRALKEPEKGTAKKKPKKSTPKRAVKRQLKESEKKQNQTKRRKLYQKTALEDKYGSNEYFLTSLHHDFMQASREVISRRAKEPLEHYPDPSYLQAQDTKVFNLKLRQRNLKVLCGICNSIKARRHTLHLAVRLIDRYASKVKLREEFSCLLPFAAFSLASKYLEKRSYSMNTYPKQFREVKSSDQLVSMERHILKIVKWRLDDILPFHFAERFFLFAQCELDRFMTDGGEQLDKKTSVCTRFRILLWYLLELASLDYFLLPYAQQPETIAAACVYQACDWTSRLKWDEYGDVFCKEMDCKVEELTPICSRMEAVLLTDFPEKVGLYRKYVHDNYAKMSEKIKTFVHHRREKRQKDEKDAKLSQM